MSDDAVTITGIGAWSAVGGGVAAIRDAMYSGRSGIRPVTRFDTAPFAAHLAGEIVEEPLGSGVSADRCVAYAVAAAAEAWRDAGVVAEPHRIAVVVGTSSGGDGSEHVTAALEDEDHVAASRIKADAHHRIAAIAVAGAIGARGPRITLSAACASGNMAIAAGADLIRSGRADVALVGGVELLSWRRYAGFCALGVVSPAACAPFSHPIGMNLGEGAAFLVLERGADPRRRRYADLLGAGLSSDAFHATAPDPTGIARALATALADAGVLPGEVGYYNAHATGTASNDAAEWRAVQRVFGDRPPPLSASKAFFGHTFGAAGPLEAVVTLIGLADGVFPQTLHFTGRRADGPVDPIGQDRPRGGAFDVAVSHNAAFGGANATVVFGAAGRPPRIRPRRRVWVGDTGVIAAAGGVVPDPDVARAIRGADPREVDRFGAMVAIAAGRCVGGPVRGDFRDKTGLFVGTSRRPTTATREFRASLERGGAGASAAAFARTVMNAATGAATRLLQLRGPTLTYAVGPGSGLFAVAGAVRWLELHGDADRIVAGGADERDRTLAGFDPERAGEPRGEIAAGEGAACALLTVSPTDVAVHAAIECGPDGLADAIREACAGVPIAAVYSSAGGPIAAARETRAVRDALGDVPIAPSPAAEFGYGDAFTGAMAFASAIGAVRAGSAAVVVIGDDAEIGGIAIVLRAG